MNKKEIQKMCKELVIIMNRSKATFFVTKGNENISIPEEDLLYELKATMVTDMEMYFVKLLDELK